MKKSKLLEKLKSKEAAILLTALVVPGGFIALGLWKAYELLGKKKEVKDEESDNTEQ